MLPPVSALVAFDAAARYGSFTRAASELSLTPGAISRQVKFLEELLSLHLFERVQKKVVLTPVGVFYAKRVREILTSLAGATSDAAAFRDRGGILRLGILPTFGTRWLMPRMPRFFTRYPTVTVSFTTRMPGAFDFARENLDAAIHFGEPVWPGVQFERLMRDELVAVAAPSLARKFKRPADMAGTTLLVHKLQPTAWSKWLDAQKLEDVGAYPVLTFEIFAMILEAAVAGIGVALIPTMLIGDLFSSGDLVPLFNATIDSRQSYYLVYPFEKEDYTPVATFRAWLLSETAMSEPWVPSPPTLAHAPLAGR